MAMILDNCDSLCDSLLYEDLLGGCQHEGLALPHQQCAQDPQEVAPGAAGEDIVK